MYSIWFCCGEKFASDQLKSSRISGIHYLRLLSLFVLQYIVVSILLLVNVSLLLVKYLCFALLFGF